MDEADVEQYDFNDLPCASSVQLAERLEQESAQHDAYMEKLLAERTPTEVKVDKVIWAMRSHNWRQRLPWVLADLDDVDAESRVTCITPLAQACASLEVQQVRLLLERASATADKAVTARRTPGFNTVSGRTPMSFAVALSNASSVGRLRTPEDVALAMIAIIELLIDHGAALEPFWDRWRKQRKGSMAAVQVRYVQVRRDVQSLVLAMPKFQAVRARHNFKRWRRVTDFLIFRARVLKLFHSIYAPTGRGAKRARAEFEAASSAMA